MNYLSIIRLLKHRRKDVYTHLDKQFEYCQINVLYKLCVSSKLMGFSHVLVFMHVGGFFGSKSICVCMQIQNKLLGQVVKSRNIIKPTNLLIQSNI